MPRFRCTSCGRRFESPVVIGAGDCPHCGGDVIFDLHGDLDEPRESTRRKRRRWRIRRPLDR